MKSEFEGTQVTCARKAALELGSLVYKVPIEMILALAVAERFLPYGLSLHSLERFAGISSDQSTYLIEQLRRARIIEENPHEDESHYKLSKIGKKILHEVFKVNDSDIRDLEESVRHYVEKQT